MKYNKISISRKQFEVDYNKMTVDELSKKYNISIPTVYSVLRRLSMPQKVGTENIVRANIIFME